MPPRSPSSSTAISVYSHKIKLVTKIAHRSKQSEEFSISPVLPFGRGRSAVLCARALPCLAPTPSAQSSRLFMAAAASQFAGPGEGLGSTHLLQPGLAPLKPPRAALQALQ